MHELSGCEEKCFNLCVDNKSAIEISPNPIHHGRTKHIDVRFHFIRKCVEVGKVILRYVRTENQVADIFTKSLGIAKFVNSELKLVSQEFNDALIKEEIEGANPSRWIMILRHQ